MKEASEIAATMAGFMNALAIFASPKLHAKCNVPEILKWTAENARSLLAAPLDFTANGKALDRFRDELQALSTQLDASPDAISGENLTHARACLAALGIDAPPEG